MKKKKNYSIEQLLSLSQKEIRKRINNNQKFRKNLGLTSLYWFVHIYFPHYLKFRTAPFQKEIYKTLEGNEQFIELLAFRESAKSTITSLFYPIWEIIKGRYHFILLCSHTGNQVKQLFQNIKLEFENNKLLKKDFGPFAGEEEWTTSSVILPKYETKIIGDSVGGSSRGSDLKNIDQI
ncbi:MAG: hypothetical protein ACOC5T_08390 [Elusimicrobiota bacterium]